MGFAELLCFHFPSLPYETSLITSFNIFSNINFFLSFLINRRRWASWIKLFFSILLGLFCFLSQKLSLLTRLLLKVLYANDALKRRALFFYKSFYYHIVSYEAYWPIHKRNTIFCFTRDNTRVVKRTYFHGTYLENVTTPLKKVFFLEPGDAFRVIKLREVDQRVVNNFGVSLDLEMWDT